MTGASEMVALAERVVFALEQAAVDVEALESPFEEHVEIQEQHGFDLACSMVAQDLRARAALHVEGAGS
jgi:hypothetical protein